MAKEINIEKIKREFEKGTLPDQLEKYNELGKWLHDLVETKRTIIQQEDEELKSIQEKLNTKKQ